MRRVGLVIAAIVPMALTGCITYSLEELRHTTPSGSPFQNALAKEYLNFASDEEKQYDWYSAMHFGDKGLMAAYGKDVGPEDVADWNVPKENVQEIEQARARLLQAYAAGARESQPSDAARAQYYFDCWVEQQEENWQTDDIARCRDGLKDTLDVLTGSGKDEELLASAPAKPKPEKKKKPEPKPEPMPEPKAEEVKLEAPKPEEAKPEAGTPTSAMPSKDTGLSATQLLQEARKESYIVFFEHGSTEMTSSGEHVLGEVIETLKARQSYDIVLNGHTDTDGDAKDNLKVSEERAQVVKQRLVAGGISESQIKTFGFGESDPPVKTGDGVKEPANNRVEIFLGE